MIEEFNVDSKAEYKLNLAHVATRRRVKIDLKFSTVCETTSENRGPQGGFFLTHCTYLLYYTTSASPVTTNMRSDGEMVLANIINSSCKFSLRAIYLFLLDLLNTHYANRLAHGFFSHSAQNRFSTGFRLRYHLLPPPRGIKRPLKIPPHFP